MSARPPTAPPPRLSWFNSLYFKLVLVNLGVVLLVVWGLTWFGLSTLRSTLESSLMERQQATVQYIASELDQKLKAKVDGLASAAAHLDAGRLADAGYLRSFLQDRFPFEAEFSGGTFVFDKDGNALADYPVIAGRQGRYYGDREYFQQAVATRRPFIGKPLMARGLKKPSLAVSVPVIDAQGRVVAVVMGAVDLDTPAFLGMATDPRRLGSTELYVISIKDGIFVASSDKSRLLTAVPGPGRSRVMDDLRAGFEGSMISRGSREVEKVYSSARVPAADWVVLQAVATESLFKPVRLLAATLLAGSAAATLVALLAAAVFSHRALRQLARASGRLDDMSSGRTPLERLPEEGQSEVRHLLASFNRLTQELASQRSRLDAALNSMSDAVFISDVDGRFVEFNEAFATFHRFAGKQACRKALAEYPEILAVYKADGTFAPLEQWVVPRSLRGESGQNEEYRLQRKDTGQSWSGSYSFAPIRAPEGTIVGCVVVARDITEQKERSQTLARTQERLGLAQRSAGAGLWDWDLVAGTFVWSDELYQLFRLDPHANGASFDAWLAMVHPDDRAQARERTLGAVRDHLPLSIRFRIVLPSGELRWIDSHGDTAYDADGRGLRMSGICIDATFRKQAEDDRLNGLRLEAENRQMLEASRLKSQFFANMSHELRTPLGAIIGFADLLHSGAVDADASKRQQFLGHIRGSARHLSRLVSDVLDLSKFDAGQLEFFPEPVDLGALVSEVRDVLYPMMQSKRIDLSVVIDPSLVGLALDPARLKQVLYNYLSNAIKFSADGGTVRVRAIPEGARHFRIEVEDEGVGIATEDLPRLFVDFQQLDSGHAKRFQGTGLGLALTRRLVQARGGTVGVRSTPGRGSTFFAVLGRVDEADAPPAAPIAA